MKVTVYASAQCPWSGAVRDVLDKYSLAYRLADVDTDPAAMDEMRRKTSQANTPCVEIDGVLLIDTTGQEVEDYIISREMVRSGIPDRDGDDVGDIVASRRYIAGTRLADTTRFF